MKYPGKKRGRSVIVLSIILTIGCIQQCSGVLNSQIKNQNNKSPSDSQSSPAQTVHRREFQQNYNFNSNSNNNVNSYNGIDQQDLSQNQNYNSNNNNRGNSNLSYNNNSYNNHNQNGNTNNKNQSNNYNNYNNGNSNNGNSNSNYNNQNGGELSSNSGPPYVNIYSYSQSQNGDLSNDNDNNNNNNKYNNYYSQNNTSNNQYQIISQATGLSHNIPLRNNNKNNNQNQQQFQNINSNNGQNQHRIKLVSTNTNSNNNHKQNNPNFFQTTKSVTTTVGTQLPNEVLNAVKTPAPLATPTLYAAPTSPPDLLGHKLDLPAKMFFMYSKPDQALYIYKVTKMNLQPQSIVSQLNYVPSANANSNINTNINSNTHSHTNLPAAVPAPATPAPTYSSSILLNSNSVKQVPAPIIISNGPSYSVLRNINSNNNAHKNNHDNFNQESAASVYSNARPIINSNNNANKNNHDNFNQESAASVYSNARPIINSNNNQGGQEQQVRGQGQSFNPPPQDEWIRMTPQNPNQQQSVPNGGSHYEGNLYKKKKILSRLTATVAPEITYGRPMRSEEIGSQIRSPTKEPFHANSEENYDELIKENSQYNPRKQQQNSNSYNDDHVASRSRQPNYRNRPRKQQNYDHEDEEPLSYGPPPVTRTPTVVSSGIAGPAQQFVQADGNGNDVEVRVRLRTQSARIRDADI